MDVFVSVVHFAYFVDGSLVESGIECLNALIADFITISFSAYYVSWV